MHGVYFVDLFRRGFMMLLYMRNPKTKIPESLREQLRQAARKSGDHATKVRAGKLGWAARVKRARELEKAKP